MDSSRDYVFGGNQSELERLVVQAVGLQHEARCLLDNIPIKGGWRAVDIGCGPIGILDLLSERVGAQGAVVGIEREARFFDMALGEIERRGLSNVKLVLGDALAPDLKQGSFDLAHERLVLMNLAEPDQRLLASQMLTLLKPGGIIALEDYDRITCLCYPEHPSWTIMLDAYGEAFRASGGSGGTGRTLPRLLRSAGVQNVQTKVHARFLDVGESRRTHHLGLLEVMHDKILALGRFSEIEFEEHKEALREHLADPDTMVIDHLLVQTWGSKPC
jgi:SAM-dependent methyltransferase